MRGRGIRAELGRVWRGLNVYTFESCRESSQDIARRLFQGEPVLVLCGEIASARGRLGRRWHAPKGGLWLTLAVSVEDAGRLPLLSLAAGVAVAKAVRSATGLDARLKWPNDVVVEGRKVAGVLVEAAQLGRGFLALVGVGVNVNNELPPELSDSAASLRGLLGSEVDSEILLAELLGPLYTYFCEVESGGTGAIISEWKTLSATLGRRVRVTMPGGLEVRGVAVDVDEQGRLIVETDGRLFTVDAGEVEHLRMEEKH